jgi:predicted nucleic acid-binding protein
MHRFVFDTDVIIAAMRSPSGASAALLDEAATRQKNTTNSHFEKMSSWERLSSREKSLQNATHTVSGNEPKCITKIAEKNLVICQKIA